MTLPIDSEIERTRERMSDREKIEMLREALDDVPLMSVSLEYNRGEFIEKFYAWYEGKRKTALAATEKE